MLGTLVASCFVGLTGVNDGVARWRHACKQARATPKLRTGAISQKQLDRFASECREQVRRGRAYDKRRVRCRTEWRERGNGTLQAFTRHSNG